MKVNEDLTKPEINLIYQNNIAPELLPALNKTNEIQDLRKLDEADKKDIQEWIDTA